MNVETSDRGPALLELVLSLPVRPDLPRFAAFCRAEDSAYLSNCNRDKRLRHPPLTLS